MEPATNIMQMPSFPATGESARLQTRPKPLLNVEEVAIWLGVSAGWVRDHASGRRQPRLHAIKLGPAKGKGLWKFREEDVLDFIRDRRLR